MNMRTKIKRALLSVYDKTGLVDLAKGLHELGVEIVSSGEHVGRSSRPRACR